MAIPVVSITKKNVFLSRSLFNTSAIAAQKDKKIVVADAPIIELVAEHVTARVSIKEAKAMPKNYSEFPSSVLLNAALNGDQEAKEERMIREIMSVENVEWDEAYPIFLKMVQSNRQGIFFATMPQKTGIALALIAGFGSFPLIFDINTVMAFNEVFVTSDVPEAKDLETPLEVGSWAWNWMEPPLGQISFFLLCMQFARSQLENLGAKPFTGWFKSRRAARIAKEYPQYNQHVVMDWSTGDSLLGADVTFRS